MNKLIPTALFRPFSELTKRKPMETPQIKIIGLVGSGKSTLAHLIKSTLGFHGIECEIVGCEDDSKVVSKNWNQRLKSLEGRTIRVETIQAVRPRLEPDSEPHRYEGNGEPSDNLVINKAIQKHLLKSEPRDE